MLFILIISQSYISSLGNTPRAGRGADVNLIGQTTTRVSPWASHAGREPRTRSHLNRTRDTPGKSCHELPHRASRGTWEGSPMLGTAPGSQKATHYLRRPKKSDWRTTRATGRSKSTDLQKGPSLANIMHGGESGGVSRTINLVWTGPRSPDTPRSETPIKA